MKTCYAAKKIKRAFVFATAALLKNRAINCKVLIMLGTSANHLTQISGLASKSAEIQFKQQRAQNYLIGSKQPAR
jgi:hypothetical protein